MAKELEVLTQANTQTEKFSSGNRASMEIAINESSVFGTGKIRIKEFMDDNFEAYLCSQPNVIAEFTLAGQVIPISGIKNGSFFRIEVVNADVTTNIIMSYIY